MEQRATKRTTGFVFLAILALLPGVFFAVSMGALKIEAADIINSIFHNTGTLEDMMIRDVRLPRVICVLVTGGILGMTGSLMQGVTRNPIAEPSLLGISQGATLFVACFYAAGIGATTGNVMLAAFLGALLSGVMVLLFTMKNPGNMSITRLLLAGTAMSTLFTALTTIAGLLSNQSQMIAFWVSGGFRNASWLDVKIIVTAGVIGFTAAVFLSPKINILSLGDDVAVGLGEHPARVRLITILLVIPICAATVVVGKTIGFVGLMVPQTLRLLIGEDYRRIIPCSFLLGALLLTYADLAARLLYEPYEIPIGIFTALFGVPFFLAMAAKERG
ncbi:MAG: iron ABC transporter permease [Roseburia sp.]|nr:iron ABC transporter permease [Roseburia sp.]